MLSLRRMPPGDLRIWSESDGHISARSRLEGKSYYSTVAGRVPRPVNSGPQQSRRGHLPLRAVDVIAKKRDGQELSAVEIEYFIQQYTSGEIPDYQASAWLMAALLRGMTRAETAALTNAMLLSGEVLDLSDFPAAQVDKHSTGGVGDKTSLVLAPLVAYRGLIVPMIRGRVLGHTGGTLDKLESSPGFNVNLNVTSFPQI